MQCRSINDKILSDYIDAEIINKELLTEIDEHVKACPCCAKRFETLKQNVSEVFAQRAVYVPPDSVWHNIKDSIANKPTMPRTQILYDLLDKLSGLFLYSKTVILVMTIGLLFIAVTYSLKTNESLVKLDIAIENVELLALLTDPSDSMMDMEETYLGTTIENHLR